MKKKRGAGATKYRESYEQSHANSQLLGRASMERAGQSWATRTLQRGSSSSGLIADRLHLQATSGRPLHLSAAAQATETMPRKLATRQQSTFLEDFLAAVVTTFS